MFFFQVFVIKNIFIECLNFFDLYRDERDQNPKSVDSINKGNEADETPSQEKSTSNPNTVYV